MIPKDETFEFLNGTSDVKSTSPNSKRVSPPKKEFGSSIAQRMGRKKDTCPKRFVKQGTCPKREEEGDLVFIIPTMQVLLNLSS